MRQLTVWTLVVLTLVPSVTVAQEHYPERLGPLAQAALKAASNDRMLLMRSGASQQTQPQQGWSDRHPVLSSVLGFGGIFAAVGATLGALQGGADPDAHPPKESRRLQAAGVGALILGGAGALLGFGCATKGCF